MTSEIQELLAKCLRCPHMVCKCVVDGIPQFRCNAAKDHCHYKGQKVKLNELAAKGGK